MQSDFENFTYKMLPSICKSLANGKFIFAINLVKPVIKPSLKSDVTLQLHKSNELRRLVHQLVHSKATHEVSKKPKIRTYYDYEKQFVNFPIRKCYSCYVVSIAIALGIGYVFWGNIKEIQPFSSIFDSSSAKDRNKSENQKDEKQATKVKSYYLKR